MVTALGLVQIVSWGSSYYLPAVLAKPISVDTGWSLPWVVGGLSLGLLAGGVVSPRVGRTVEYRGGRQVLACSSILFALGLGLLSWSANIPAYLAAWLIIGLAMGCGLYDATFATLGRIYGQAARPVITIVTLFGGFASTVCWPLAAFLEAELGWRAACQVFAGLHLVVCLPLSLCILPRWNPAPPASRNPGDSAAASVPSAEGSSGRKRTVQFALLTVIFTMNSGLVTVISVHLISILQARGMGLAAAVALGTLVGPSQVASRLMELLFGRYYHPLWTMTASLILVAGGLVMMMNQEQISAVTIVMYGSGVGLSAISRGTIPLRLFGQLGYASLMGRLAMPPLLSQALFPSLASFLMVNGNTDGILAIGTSVAATNVILTAFLWLTVRKPRPR